MHLLKGHIKKKGPELSIDCYYYYYFLRKWLLFYLFLLIALMTLVHIKFS